MDLVTAELLTCDKVGPLLVTLMTLVEGVFICL